MNSIWPHVALDRILDALEQELVATSDEEILEAAKELGMNPAMRGSAAFFGLKYSAKHSMADWFAGFDPSVLKRVGVGQSAKDAEVPPAPADAESRRPAASRQKKEGSDD